MANYDHPATHHHDSLAALLARLGTQWGWFAVLGGVLLALGLIAAVHVVVATLVSVFYVGIVMMAGGIFQLMHAWRIKAWSSFVFWSMGGLLYAGAGILAIINPLAGARILTLLLGAVLTGAGAVRFWIWFRNRRHHQWQWLGLSGAITFCAGLIVTAGWPGNSIWMLGLLLVFDLCIQGGSLLLLGFALRRRHPQNTV